MARAVRVIEAEVAPPRRAARGPARRRLSGWLPCAALLAAAVLYRLPPLLNARGVDSDAAVVGLQAAHLLRGEWSWFLWGAGYQGVGDAVLVALGFAVTGARALTLMAVPLLGYLLLIALVFATLRRRLGPAPAALATLPLVCAPQAVNGVALAPPRQWAITAVFAACWALDGASGAWRPGRWYAAGALLGALALYLDLFTLQFLPGLAAFALACCFDGGPPRGIRWRRIGACALGCAAGLGLVWLARQQPGAGAPPAADGLAAAPAHLRLLLDAALPWVLGARVFIPGAGLYPAPWRPPATFLAVQYGGALLFLAGLAWGGLAVGRRRLPWPVRRLGGLGALVAACSLGGFVVAAAPRDMWSARYLAPLIWMAPFALAPAAYVLRPRRFALVLAPYLVVAAVGGWLSYGPYVRGPLPVYAPRGAATAEAELGRALRERGVAHAAAPYWLAYRLTFLWGERPIVVPLDATQDRYAPYRRGFAAAPEVALIFHPADPRATAADYEARLRRAGARYERLEVAGYTVLLWRRGPPGVGVPCCPGPAAGLR
ncbi:MAG TPA: hypothetical protein VFW96_16455 [Thermomicrobiales bacterium]|nr:hypothetical protein [Thermomicrobiales bacterium]